MSLPGRLDLVGNRWGVYRNDTWGPKRVCLTRVVRDANGTIGDATLTSATAVFAAADVGVRVVPLQPNGQVDPNFATLTIASRTNGTTVELSSPLPATLTNRLLMIMRRDVTGHTFTSHIKSSFTANGPPLAEIDCAVVDATLGYLDLSMTAAENSFTLATDAVWDLQSVDGTGRVKTWLRGTVHSDPDATQ